MSSEGLKLNEEVGTNTGTFSEEELAAQIDAKHEALLEEMSPGAKLATEVSTMAEQIRDMATSLIREAERGLVTATAFANSSTDREKEGFTIALEEQKMVFGAIAKMLGTDKLEDEPETFFDRLVIERDELAIKFEDLGVFMNTKKFKKLDVDSKRLLNQQSVSMNRYLLTLNDRIELLTPTEKDGE